METAHRSALDQFDEDAINQCVVYLVADFRRRMSKGNEASASEREKSQKIRRHFGEKFAEALCRRPEAEREEFVMLFWKTLRAAWLETLRNDGVRLDDVTVRGNSELAFERIILEFSLQVLRRKEQEEELQRSSFHGASQPIIRRTHGGFEEVAGEGVLVS